MGRNSLNLIKLTSITFLFEFLNSFSFYLPILLLFLVKLNSIDSLEILKLNNDYLANTYIKSLVKEDIIQIRFDDFEPHTVNYNKLQSILMKSEVRYAKSIELTGFVDVFKQDLNSTHSHESLTLIDLFFPNEIYSQRAQIEHAIKIGQLNTSLFRLDSLNISSNGLSETFLDGFSLSSSKPSLTYSALFNLILNEYISNLRLLQLSHNNLRHLERKHLELFGVSKLETLLLDHNKLTSIRHDTFYDLKYLKYLDLSYNKLKLVHPMTFSYESSSTLNLINLQHNMLKAIFKPTALNQSVQFPLVNLKYLYLEGNKEIACDCGLLWLYRRMSKISLDNFDCFDSIDSEQELKDKCPSEPSLVVNTTRFEKTSAISYIRWLSKRWFAWTVFHDYLPLTTPFPYLFAKQTNLTKDNFEDEEETDLDEKIQNQEKHLYHAWLSDDAVFDCSNKNNSENAKDETNSTIIWKTQYGYLSYLDKDLMEALRDDQAENSTQNSTNSNYNSFKVFFKMNRLTKISKKLTVRISKRFGAESFSDFYVNEKNQLIVTNMRQLVSGPFVCLSINQKGVKTYEYDIHVRTGVSEYFIYSLFVSIISMIVPSIIGIIVCCICEYQADKNYPMTPPCYPTPMASTPPNFDFNEWMANAASYLPNLPNLNIHETLEQVSKRLRKGMEKASVTMKSLGMTSSAYIYSMYEQSSQRFYDLRQYVPTLNVPTLNLPTMRYPPMGQLANRMKMGMGNMFIQLREFCGTSDLTHTASIVDIEADCSASNAVGKTYILDQFNLKQPPNPHNLYRFLNLIKEESKLNSKKSTTLDQPVTEEEEVDESPETGSSNEDIIKPSTSGLNTFSTKSSNCQIYKLEDSDSEISDSEANKNEHIEAQTKKDPSEAIN